MKKEWGIVLVVVGILLMGAGFYPLRREVKTEEKGVREETWWREETLYREVTQIKEEPYIETAKKEITIEDEILHSNNGILKKYEKTTFPSLKKGYLILLEVKAASDIVVLFYPEGQGCIPAFHVNPFKGPNSYQWYDSNPKKPCVFQGDSFDKSFTLPVDDNYVLEYFSMDPLWHRFPQFSINLIKVHYETKTETITKIRNVEVKVQEPYTTKIPYTTNVPYTIVTEKTEKYNIEALRYAGLFLILAGAFIFWKNRKS